MKKNKSHKPDWVPENAGNEFAIKVVEGVAKSDAAPLPTFKKRKILSKDDYVKGVLNNERTILARAITLVESNSHQHREIISKVLDELLPYSGKSIRIGVTGFPGAGKSTLIEVLGMYLLSLGHKVAVLAIDPSSTVTKGSILGDKTRMEKLSREENCFIRPSPSGGYLGGVARKSKETIMVCEAAGYDVIIVETVGVGQSETTVRSMVDFFLLLMIAGAGDELQGIKKGVIELADAIYINKADGNNKIRAMSAKSEFALALKYLSPATEGWLSQTGICSAITGEGIHEIWEMINKFIETTKASSVFDKRRKQQALEWVFNIVNDYLKESFYGNRNIQKEISNIKNLVLQGDLLPTTAAENLIKKINFL